MILFLMSFLFIFVSSYIFASFISQKNITKASPVMIYLFLSAFVQIIFSFEILSLFKAINQFNFLIINFMFFTLSLFFVKIFKIKIYRPDLKLFFLRVKKALKRDKILIISVVSVLFFILIAFVLVLLAPVSVSDAMAYHVPRAVNWIVNSSLGHFETLDMRMNTMPINSELIFAWVILFLKSDIALGCFFGVYQYNLRSLLLFVRTRIWNEKKNLDGVYFFCSCLRCN